MHNESYSYIDAMYAVLKHKGWIQCSKAVLAGMTISAFRFTVDRRLTSESTTAYNWIAENFLAADFIGAISSQNAGFSFNATFPLYQKEAVRYIKESIDRNMGVIIWKDAFVIICGYDDDRQHFYFSDGTSEQLQTLAYESFGRNTTPYWYYQILEERIDIDPMEIYKESYVQAVYKWESHDLMLPKENYSCGRDAYEAIIHALETGEYDREGAWNVLRCYAAAKQNIADYSHVLQNIWKGSGLVAEHYAKVAAAFQQIRNTIYPGDGKRIADGQAEKILPYLVQARNAEERAVEAIKVLQRETIGNRFHDISLR